MCAVQWVQFCAGYGRLQQESCINNNKREKPIIQILHHHLSRFVRFCPMSYCEALKCKTVVYGSKLEMRNVTIKIGVARLWVVSSTRIYKFRNRK